MNRVHLLALVVGSSCVTLNFPYTAAQLSLDSAKWPDKALAHYLSQPEADVGACDLASPGDHAMGVNDETFGSILEGVEKGGIAPEKAGQCMGLLLSSGSPKVATDGLEVLSDAARSLIKENNPEVPHLDAFIVASTTLVNRPARLGLPRDRALKLTGTLNDRLANLTPQDPRLGPAQALLEALELDTNTFHGRSIDPGLIASVTDEGALTRMTRRLPDEGLRTAARRQLLTLRAGRSQYPEVRGAVEAVVARMLSTGHNAVDLTKERVTNAQFNPRAVSGVLVRQHPFDHSVTLLSYDPNSDSAASQLGAVELVGALQFTVTGHSMTLSLCPAVEADDPSPCVDAAALSTTLPFVRLDLAGALHFTENLAFETLAAFGGETYLTVPLTAAGVPVANVSLPLWFELPDDMVFHGSTGGRGPALGVSVSRMNHRYRFGVRAGDDAPVETLVEPTELQRFSIVSRGGKGATGIQGLPGSKGPRGTPGAPGTCPGGNGGRGDTGAQGGQGGRGGPGGRGGDGGNIVVQLVGVAQTDVVSHIRSEGGPGGDGGPGGKGGPGGDGGPGGPGATCMQGQTRNVGSNGSQGSQGKEGTVGPKGPTGPPGGPGVVQYLPGR